MNKKVKIVIAVLGGIVLIFLIAGTILVYQRWMKNNSIVDPVACITELEINDGSIKDNATVREENFSNFKRVSVAYLQNREVVGVYEDTEFRNHSPRELAILLIETGVVQTYDHISSSVCLISEEEIEENVYKASFLATHVFYTNERVEKSYEFDLMIDKDTGEVSVSP